STTGAAGGRRGTAPGRSAPRRGPRCPRRPASAPPRWSAPRSARRDRSGSCISRVPPSRGSGARIDTRREIIQHGSLPPGADAASAAVDQVYRSDWGRIVATLIGLVRDFDVAEEAAQEAFAAAVEQWPAAGVPAAPRAWIIQTARHKAIDRIR